MKTKGKNGGNSEAGFHLFALFDWERGRLVRIEPRLSARQFV